MSADVVCIQLHAPGVDVPSPAPRDVAFVVTTARVAVRCCAFKDLRRMQPGLATACVQEKRRRERALDAVLVHEELLVLLGIAGGGGWPGLGNGRLTLRGAAAECALRAAHGERGLGRGRCCDHGCAVRNPTWLPPPSARARVHPLPAGLRVRCPSGLCGPVGTESRC
jgi:hypothetical protein